MLPRKVSPEINRVRDLRDLLLVGRKQDARKPPAAAWSGPAMTSADNGHRGGTRLLITPCRVTQRHW